MNSQAEIAVERTPVGEPQVWAIVLAGGEGLRLRPLARRVSGEDRPKQYVRLFGDRTLLGQTLDRIALAIPLVRTAVVTLRGHSRYVAEEFRARRAPHVLVQPADRGTAAGILFPTQWISWRAPEATVAIFPSDHFVLGEATFMAHVTQVAAWVDEHPDRIVLLGARPTEPEVEYGWIELGRPLSHHTADGNIWEVRRFWEKPSEEVARICLEAGCLWNTLVLVGKAATLLRAGHELLPDVSSRLVRILPFFGSDDEAWATHQAYALMPKTNFSRSILEPCPHFLAVSQLPPLTWSDLGSPRRVLQVVKRIRCAPSWAHALDLPA
jgi:mannose-1-phosphate guanylyltransferase